MPRKLLIIAALALTLSACGGSDDAQNSVPEPDDTAALGTSDDASADGSAVDGAGDDTDETNTDDTDDGRKPIGESFVVSKDDGPSFELTLTAVEPGMAAEEHQDLVPDGEELHIAYFTVKNVGEDDSEVIIYDNYLVDADNQMVHESIINLDGCESFNEWNPVLEPGESVEGCVGFTIDPDFEPIELMAAGFGDNAIPIWTL